MNEQKQPDKINLLHQDDIYPDIKQDLPETPKKTGLPKWVVALITVLIIAAIGIAGYFAYNHFFGPGVCINQCGDGKCGEIVCQAIGCPCAETIESCSEDCKKEEITDPTADPSIDEADWQTFQHNGWNYTISYPDNLYIKENPQGDKFPGDTSMCPMCGDGGQTLIISDLEKMGIQHFTSNEKIHIVISTSKKEKNDSLYDYILKLTEGAENISQFTINNIIGYKILGDQESPISIWIVENENSEWVYSLYGMKTSTFENFELMMDILQTFKFIE